MRSSNVDRFNHDVDASGYDSDVQNEVHPIRTGYDTLLTWVANQVPVQSSVIDLGCGTGNLSVRLDSPSALIGVDISQKMVDIAKGKLAAFRCEFRIADLLECFDDLPVVDAIVSTYAIHHLRADEKRALFQHIWDHLRVGGVAALGDLMFETKEAEAVICKRFADAGQSDVVADIRDEFFWDLETASAQLKEIGFVVSAVQFSELSWAVRCERPASS